MLSRLACAKQEDLSLKIPNNIKIWISKIMDLEVLGTGPLGRDQILRCGEPQSSTPTLPILCGDSIRRQFSLEQKVTLTHRRAGFERGLLVLRNCMINFYCS